MPAATESPTPSVVSEAPFEVPECLTQASNLSGDVVIRAAHPDNEEEIVEFWCHSILIYHSCQYFQSILSGEWSETSQTIIPAGNKANSTPTNKRKRGRVSAATPASTPGVVVKGVIDLTDQTADDVCNLLRFIYPHLDLHLTMDNVTGLLVLADKLCYEALKDHCQKFLKDQKDKDPFAMLKISLDGNLQEFGLENIKDAVYSKHRFDPGSFVRASEVLSRSLAQAILQRRLNAAESLYAVLANTVMRMVHKNCSVCRVWTGSWSSDPAAKSLVLVSNQTTAQRTVSDVLEATSKLSSSSCRCLDNQIKRLRELTTDSLLTDWKKAVELQAQLTSDEEDSEQ